MKKFFLIAFLLCVSVISFSQNPVSYTGVFATNDTTLSKNDLYERGKYWVSETLTSSENIIVLADKDNGAIKGNHKFKYVNNGVGGVNGSYASGYISYSFQLWFKDGKCKYEFTNFSHRGYNGPWSYGLVDDGPCRKMGWKSYLEDIKITIDSEVPNLVNSLNKRLNQKTVSW